MSKNTGTSKGLASEIIKKVLRHFIVPGKQMDLKFRNYDEKDPSILSFVSKKGLVYVIVLIQQDENYSKNCFKWDMNDQAKKPRRLRFSTKKPNKVLESGSRVMTSKELVGLSLLFKNFKLLSHCGITKESDLGAEV